MAISTQRKLSDLQRECQKLGLTVHQSGSRVSKTDYVLALREYNLNQLYHGNIPSYLKNQLELLEEGPMLAAQTKKAGEILPIYQELMRNPYVVCEEKIDGNRLLVHIGPEGIHCFSRNISVKDYLPVDYSDNLVTQIDFDKVHHSYILDGEITATDSKLSTILSGRGVICETQLQATSALLAMEASKSREIQEREGVHLRYNVFDCIMIDGTNLMNEPLLNRKKVVLQAQKELSEAGMDIVNVLSVTGDQHKKELFYKKIVSSGGEGIILKDARSIYVPGRRDVNIWAKVKRTANESFDGDTINGFVTGFKVGEDPDKWNYKKVSALEFSVNLTEGGTHVIANISNLEHADLEKWTVHNPDGSIGLVPEMYGKVAELTGQDISARSRALVHAALVRWLPNETSEDCVMSMKKIEENIL